METVKNFYKTHQAEIPKLISEFVGTYILVLTIGCNVLGGVTAWAVTSIASALMVMIYALGSVSGAHFNPAVTLAIFMSNKMSGGIPMVLAYMVTQVTAGVCAAMTYLVVFMHNFNLEPGTGYGIVEASIAEFIYTFMLCFVVLNVACASASAGNQYYGLAIGFVIVAGGYAVGSISGGAFNPAVALGVDLVSLNRGFGYCFVYVLVEFAAALAAAGVFRLVRTEDFGGAKSPTVLSARLLSEFLGTFILVATVGFNVLTGSVAAAFSIGASLMCMIYALGSVSGAHFNPAVTLSIWLSGRDTIAWKDALYYCAAQVAGGVCAGVVFTTTTGKSIALGPVGGFSWLAAALMEAIFTAVLCFVVLSVATTKNPSKDMFGFAIGSCVTVGGFAAGAVSGGNLNPAVSLGIDVSHALFGNAFMASILYTLFQAVGASAAAGVFYFVQPDEYNAKTAKGRLPK